MTVKYKQVFVFSLVIGSSIFGNSQLTFAANTEEASEITNELQNDFLTESQIIEKIKSGFEYESKNRSPADSGDPTLESTSKTFQIYRTRYLSLKTTSELTQFLNDLETNYASFKDNDIKFFAARILPSKHMAGFFWRMIPLIRKNRMSQEVASGVLRGLYEQIAIRFPSEQNKVVFEYLTQPQNAYYDTFNSVDDIQKFVVNQFEPSLEKSIARLEQIKITTPIVMDTELRFGEDGFAATSSHKQFKWIGNAELSATISRLHKKCSSLLVFSAYSLNDYIAYRKEIARDLGIDTLTSNDYFPITGLDRKTRVEILNKYPHLFERITAPLVVKGKKVEYGKHQMVSAYFHLARSVFYIQTAWNQIAIEAKNKHHLYNINASVIDPDLFGSKASEIDAAMENLSAMISPLNAKSSTFILHESIHGQKASVDLKSFYLNPPQNLHSLLPNEFSPGDPRANKGGWVTVSIGNTKTQYRDYSKGRATGWNKEAYHNLFPSLTDGHDVDDYQRILLRTCGARYTSSLLFGFVK